MNKKKDRIVGDWWTDNPMSYSEDRHGGTFIDGKHYEPETKQYFETIDKVFLSWNLPLCDEVPFDKLFPYGDYKGKKVLEIGCGLGTMAMLWAKSGANVTAIDLSTNSVNMTKKRFDLFGLSGDIRQSDARALEFGDATFDYAYSWGVLHHSPDLKKSLHEMMRVLKPEGRFTMMLYNRNSLYYHYKVLFTEGYLNFEDRFLSPIELTSRYTDADEMEGNPHTWPVTTDEIRNILESYSENLSFKLLGAEVTGYVSQIMPGIGKYVPVWMLKPWARRFGWSLWIAGFRT